MMRRQFTDKEDAFIRQKYEQGFRLADMAKHFKVTPPTIAAAVKRAGGTMRPRTCKRLKYGRKEVIGMLRDRQAGMSYAKIAEKYGCTDACVCRYVKLMSQSEMITAGAIRQSEG